MDWPVYIDSFNLLEVEAVPMTFLVNPKGVITKVSPSKKNLDSILKNATNAINPTTSDDLEPYWSTLLKKRSFNLFCNLASERNFVELFKSIKMLKKSDYKMRHEHLEFMTGVAYKMRSESPFRKLDDFSKAIDHWETALELRPNQYIWRRRIQQYGPILGKPYPFYDWVEIALKELKEKGEVPFNENFVLTESEQSILTPTQTSNKKNYKIPDPFNKLKRGNMQFVNTRVLTIPSHPKTGRPFRVFVQLDLKQPDSVQWNNEGAASHLYFEKSNFNKTSIHRFWTGTKEKEYSTEQRIIDFELNYPRSGIIGGKKLPAGYIVVNLCDRLTGACFTRRIDFSIPINKVDIQ